MHGRGNFEDPRLGISVRHDPDLVTPKLAALRAYQHSLKAPPALGASYDRAAARRGKRVFDANCAACHLNGNLTDNNTRIATGAVGADSARATSGILHSPSETGMDSTYAARTATKMYRTTPLRALWQHPPYFHDGSAQTLDAVVEHYDRVRNLKLRRGQKRDLVQYLMSL
jgi:cytochrome c peroxidase